MATTTRIDRFDVIYSSNTFAPRIGLVNGGKFFATLVFCPDGQPLPPDTNTNKHMMLFYHLDDFQNVKELLETEKNIFALWAGTGPGFENAIVTTDEPVGTGIEVKAA
jgi:hypothetical protein